MEDKTLQRLAERSTDKNIFVFTDFLEEAEQKIAIRMQKFVTLWGGAEFCTRKVARFGNTQELGYEIGRASVGKECVRRCRSRWSPYH